MERFWVTLGLCFGVVLWCGYFLGIIGVRKDCGHVCKCIGRIELRTCTGINLSVNQLVAIQEILRE